MLIKLRNSMIFQDSSNYFSFTPEELIIQIVIAVVCTVAAIIFIYIDAKRRGINPKPWIILTLISWVCGLIFYFYYRNNQLMQQMTNAQFNQNLSKDDNGNKEDEQSDNFYGFVPLSQIRLSKQNFLKDSYICEECGAVVKYHSIYCPICGKKE
ncbi:MAG: hypothetical protein ACTSXK_00710 [Promethearchaeota archaeon]